MPTNVAVTDLADDITTVQLLPETSHPFQAAKTLPNAGVAESVTTVLQS
jgi:hypothetical protein